jgi:uncharacterized protein with PIN domain
MKRSREEQRKALVAEAEAMIEEYLGWNTENEAPTMSEIEEVVLGLRQKMGQRMAEEVLANQEATQPVEAPKCERCGEAMVDKGKKSVRVESRLGSLQAKRVHYYCGHCGSGFFPPG